MLDRILSAPVVVVASALLALGVTTYLNMSEVNRDKEWRTARLRQFILNDQDADGYLDRAEAAAAYRREFTSLDFDQDGMVSGDEFVGLRKSWAKYHVTRRWKIIQAGREAEFVKVDRNGDGRLDADEYVDTYLVIGFAAMDRDGDRRVVRAEFLGSLAPR